MHPANHAATFPDKPAVIMAGSGETMTYGELDALSSQGAHLLRAHGLKRGGGIAVMMKNGTDYFTAYWAAQRAGLYFTPIATHLTADEAAYIVQDSGAGVLLISQDIAAAGEMLERRATLLPGVEIFAAGRAFAGLTSWRDAGAGHPQDPIADQSPGAPMYYSSGTTGRPKGVKIPLPEGPYDMPAPLETRLREHFAADETSIYLSPAPLYHGAPTSYTAAFQRLGATIVVMERFDPLDLLRAIETHKVTHIQLVPTMFVRLLRLPEAERHRHDLSSLTFAVHAAAPCPVEIKHQMLNWWGPIIYEYYAGSEANGQTFISPHEWLRRPGSVGRPILGRLHICADDGAELPAGQTGNIYFEGPSTFVYHNDPEKTADGRHPDHPTWSRIGDVGYIDDEGYLFLTDRASDMIISGGVNIYPQEVENTLILHPAVIDVAVFGVPDEDMGEQVKAVVKPRDWDEANADLAAELMSFCRSQISHVKCPKSIDFERELPRLDTGKLYKRLLKQRYWPAAGEAARP
ncbi:acyl-CoA synthetase [Sphingomonas sp.]|uniref:acyl-CoA synthetase n=1 Tax=Sphingomonas sp. TaxID=28214 RepID=UPI002DD62B23|nr:acyl-CoA synthetase [Sphingomonas sp.]